ncbi:unnamed protein product [Hymenolepis diminuta]|uniref:Hexosyltransferase n=1 Tax=Hymenolepis diminuta TaxID=6216 RepID=A0A0R3SHF7_HYMDI|nr:unnamed protein product [Hymenolepis diminuta]VUZ40035.1 unnamed protein product [Hymenolepis diminuta]
MLSNISDFGKGFPIAVVFSLGLPRSQQDNKFLRGENIFELKESGGEHLNPKSLRKTAQLLEEEMKEFNDLLIGDYEDTYFNLTVKSHYSYTWISTFCRSNRPAVLFLDDDVPFSPWALKNALHSMPQFHRSNLFHGKVETKSFAVRPGSLIFDNRWAVLKSEVPWPVYSPYLQGFYVLAGFKQVELLTLGMPFTKYFPIEDAWIGLVARRMNVTPRDIHVFMRRTDMLLSERKGFEPVEKKVYVR